MPQRFDFFLSHNSQDKPMVEQIAEQLLEEGGLTSWIDIWSIPAAADWEAEIRKAIRACRGTLIFLGPNGWGPWHAREALLALDHARSDPGYLVIPVALSGFQGAVPLFAEDKEGRLEQFFTVRNWVRHDQDGTELLDQIRSAMGEKPPHPLGRARVTPYVIRRDARRWDAPGSSKRRRHPSRLYRGSQLQDALAVADQYPGQFDALALEFLRSGQRGQKTRAWYWAIGAAAVSIALLTLTVREATERAIATSRLMAALSQEEHAKGNIASTALLAVESWRSKDTLAARRQLFSLCNRYGHLRAVLKEKSADDLISGWTAINPAGTQLAVCTGADLSVWDLAKPSEPTNLELRSGLGPVAYSTTGALAVASDTGIRIWHQPGTKNEPYVQIEDASPKGHAFIGDDKLCYINKSGQAAVCEISSSRTEEFPKLDLPLIRLIATHDPRTVITSDQHGLVQTWRVGDKIEPGASFQTAAKAPVDILASSPDGAWLIAGKAWEKVELFNASTGSAIVLPENITAASFIDHERFVVGFRDGALKVFSVTSPTESPLLELHGHTERIEGLCSQGGVGISADDGGTVLLWRWDKHPIFEQTIRISEGPIVDVKWSGGGERIAILSRGEGFRTMDPVTHKVSPLVTDPKARVLAIEESGTRIATASDDGYLRLWEMEGLDWKERDSVKLDDSARALAWHRRTIACGTGKGNLSLWSVERGKLKSLTSVAAHMFAIRQLSFDRVGERLASGSSDGAAKIWDVRKLSGGGKEPIVRIGRGRGQAHFVALHPLGETLLVGGAHPILERWRVTPDEILGEMPHANGLNAIAADSAGEYALAMDQRGFFSLWEIQSAQGILERAKVESGLVECMAVHPSNPRAVAGTFGGQLILINLCPDNAAQHLLRVANRNFSPREWNQFMGDKRYKATIPELPPGVDRPKSYD